MPVLLCQAKGTSFINRWFDIKGWIPDLLLVGLKYCADSEQGFSRVQQGSVTLDASTCSYYYGTEPRAKASKMVFCEILDNCMANVLPKLQVGLKFRCPGVPRRPLQNIIKYIAHAV